MNSMSEDEESTAVLVRLSPPHVEPKLLSAPANPPKSPPLHTPSVNSRVQSSRIGTRALIHPPAT